VKWLINNMPERQLIIAILSSFALGALSWTLGRKIIGTSAFAFLGLPGLTEAAPTSAVNDANSVIIQKNLFDKPLDGTAPSTGETEFGTTEGLRVGVWDHTVGNSLQANDDEVFVVLRGKGRIILDDKTSLELEPGTVGRLLKGQNRKWEIASDFRKVWITRKEDGVL
jgi:uncharacterized cupin superfamily protein